MELRHLETLLAIAEEGSFTAAADALATVQSNVSDQVRQLETELGVPLLVRSRRGAEPTEFGLLVARLVLGVVFGDEERVRRNGEGNIGTLEREVNADAHAGSGGIILRQISEPVADGILDVAFLEIVGDAVRLGFGSHAVNGFDIQRIVHRGETTDVWLAHFQDPDRNELALMSETPRRD